MIYVVDNFDSFTYNIVQILAQLGAEVTVERNDVRSAEGVLALAPAGIVISPGPGRPEGAGVSIALVQQAARIGTPLLGVCLGHQALAAAFGATVRRAPRLMHGKVSGIVHDGSGIYRGLPSPFTATRYHSLMVDADTLPETLIPTASADDDGCLMGIRHRELPLEGVQFHPESILTESGARLLENFLERCAVHA